ncbi:MAG: 4-phosphoerythronate dehydrogenase PdxB [Gammaproteobacteria bacterium]|nr:4-phosphoerythronate dehydrogenase PdxB [Gammaproteobacteria bacterium]MBU1492197.1 4-phosphoerythronate dehydrogenase PdxB [Gammaproteobacteria bacterium]MBU2065507.1 4-phosphoerythronate dehydrogenase PdxB [Gammaproteobacteria bacterium]MBU2140512.1 4-phosphoerythronate dehydrogenase PdxB [Gammaproteobacteria bacterium]MBU2218388.1 4-phosphoerythronate dehydrogenase PdxB [Gammaproteobacteria bacterium]
MHIVADENIPLLEACFARFGRISRHPGRTIDRAALGDAEVLLVRSVTQVDRALLEGSQVRFVGTCTIGTDHLDLAYLEQAGIAWASAPGCNARGVVDYVLGSLLVLAEDEGLDLAERTYGIVGAGQVGSRLAKVLRGLGWTVKVCDPPRQAAEGGEFVALEEILASCDVISLHTPLTREGAWPTWHLLGAEQLARLRSGAWLINASRGAVVDNPALCAALQARSDLRAVLDVWEGEPLADPELAARCRLATPHIAGYSLDGKLRGTLQILQAYCEVLGEPAPVLPELPAPWLGEIGLSCDADPAWALSTLCRAVYDPRRDDADFRRSLVGGDAQRRAAFDRLRKHYPMRRETDGLSVALTGQSSTLQAVVEALGARCTIAE